MDDADLCPAHGCRVQLPGSARVRSGNLVHLSRGLDTGGRTAQEADMSTHGDMKFEVVVIPVSDVDRAKEFYARLGWRLDADYDSGKDYRVIQFTPPGSGCSIIFGKNITGAAPGSAQGLYLIVSDIEAARKELLGRGVEISEVFHGGSVYAGTDEPY